MTNFWTRLIFATVIACGASSACIAQNTALTPLEPNTVIHVNLPGQALYNGENIATTGITLSSWGAGAASQDTAHGLLAGQASILIESPSFFQGGTITFPQPVALGDPSDTSKYLQISLSLAADPKYPAPAPPTDNNGFGGPNGPGGFGQQQGPNLGQNESFTGNSQSLFKLAQMPGPYQGQQPGGPPPNQVGPGGPGQFPQGGFGAPANQDTGPPPQPAKSIHVVLTFADGTQADVSRDVPIAEDMEDWFDTAFPLSNLGLKSGGQPLQLASITISTDTPCLINVGRIKLVNDTTPISAGAGGDKDITVNEQAVFKAQTSAGASTLSYQWDFDTQGAFVAQADGRRVTHTYSKRGVYTVTLEVTDVDGIKSPVTTTATVHVED